MGRLGMITVIKGADELATGVAYRLYRCGMDVVMTETETPLVVRRKTSFAEAVVDGEIIVEGVKASLAGSIENALAMFDEGTIPVLVDPEAKVVEELFPQVVIDARMAKRNLGTTIEEAPLVIGLGPGFEAGIDVHAVIETCRGNRLGRVIYNGGALPNTGVPGDIGGYTVERMVKAPVEGVVTNVRPIGEAVKKGDIVASVGDTPARSKIAGIVRGMVREGVSVPAGARIANIDPRRDIECAVISDRALSVGGGVLEAVFTFLADCDR